MANPNIVNVTTIQGKTALSQLGNTFGDIVDNGSSSGKIFKVNTIMVANTSTSSAYSVSVEVSRSSTGYALAESISVPIGSTVVIVGKDTSIYLEEGDKIRAKGSAANFLHLVASYEEIS
jgi:hypothetical protein